MSGNKKKGYDNKVLNSLSLISQFSIYMLVPIGGMSVGGYFLDKYFGTSWIVILCFFIGAVAGGQNVYRLAMKIAAQKSPEPERHILNGRNKSGKDETELSDDTVSEEKK